MSLPLYQRVALRRDLPEHNLRRGDVAILVDYVPHPERGEQGCVVEVSTPSESRSPSWRFRSRTLKGFAQMRSSPSVLLQRLSRIDLDKTPRAPGVYVPGVYVPRK